MQMLRITSVSVPAGGSVEFSPGLNVITGETGAGKSILVGALGLVLGERADIEDQIVASFRRPHSVRHSYVC